MPFSKEDEDVRKKAMEKIAAQKDISKKAQEAAFNAREREAYLSGAEKKGGFLGFGGQYSEDPKAPSQAGSTDNTGKYVAAAGMASKMMGGDSQEGGTTDSGSGAMSGAASGAAAGTAIMPGWGTAIGAVAGGIMGAASASAARKAQNAKIEANKHMALGKIAEDKGRQLSDALHQMGSRMRIS